MEAYVRVVGFLARAAGVIAAFLIGFAVLVICEMLVERYILGHTTIWQIDVVTYCIVAATFVGSAYVLMTRGHVNVDILPLHVRPPARFRLALATGLLALGFCIAIFLLCTAYWYEAYTNRWLSNTVWRARLWIPYLSMPIGLGLLILQYVADLWLLLRGRARPFGIYDREAPEDVARARAGEALGEKP
jgi:TRAP-type C4-dicarboxylate transport system permease small subunit